MVIWAFFTLFVGIALAIDLGIIGKILHILTVKSRSRNHDNNTSQKRKISSALPVGPKSDQQQQLFVIGDAALVLDSKGKALPTNAYFAEHHGRIAAQNIYALLNGEKKITGI